MKRSTLPLVLGGELGSNVLDAEPFAGPAEGDRLVAGAMVDRHPSQSFTRGGHHPLDPDAEAFITGESGLKEGDSTAFL